MLDTNIASFIVRGPNVALRTRLSATAPGSICLSAVSEAELLYGLARKPEARALRRAVASLLKHLTVLPWDRACAPAYGDLRAGLEARGSPLGNLDTLIAAHALASGCVLVSNDKALARVPGLLVEDWTHPST
jgi:tRNA(fMet)-specific endonuclease VapC